MLGEVAARLIRRPAVLPVAAWSRPRETSWERSESTHQNRREQPPCPRAIVHMLIRLRRAGAASLGRCARIGA